MRAISSWRVLRFTAPPPSRPVGVAGGPRRLRAWLALVAAFAFIALVVVVRQVSAETPPKGGPRPQPPGLNWVIDGEGVQPSGHDLAPIGDLPARGQPRGPVGVQRHLPPADAPLDRNAEEVR